MKIENLKKRVDKIVKRKKKFHVLEIRRYDNETLEQAKERYAKDNKVLPNDEYIIINVYNDKQIREKRANGTL